VIGRLAVLAAALAAALAALNSGGALAAPAAKADASAEATDCLRTAQTQSELTVCAASEAKAADQRLNHSYKSALCYVDDGDKAHFRAAQRAWIAFRDADCAVWGGGGGSIGPMNEAMCVASLSNHRAEELDSWPPNIGREIPSGPCS
jgi:uncharacterized protein YecT (DUF1311 family)